jgi:hypothetical protein
MMRSVLLMASRGRLLIFTGHSETLNHAFASASPLRLEFCFIQTTASTTSLEKSCCTENLCDQSVGIQSDWSN